MNDRDAVPVEVGERYSVEIEDLGSEGDGLARIDSFVVFVPGVDLGDRVDIRIEEVGGNHATASVVEDGEESDESREGGEQGERPDDVTGTSYANGGIDGEFKDSGAKVGTNAGGRLWA